MPSHEMFVLLCRRESLYCCALIPFSTINQCVTCRMAGVLMTSLTALGSDIFHGRIFLFDRVYGSGLLVPVVRG